MQQRQGKITAEAAASALKGAAAFEATNPNNNNHTAQQTGAGTPS